MGAPADTGCQLSQDGRCRAWLMQHDRLHALLDGLGGVLLADEDLEQT